MIILLYLPQIYRNIHNMLSAENRYTCDFVVSSGAGIPHFVEESLCITVVTNHIINLSFLYRILMSFNMVIVLIIFSLLPFENMQSYYGLFEKLFKTLICEKEDLAALITDKIEILTILWIENP